MHADKLLSSSTAEEQVVLKEVAAANAELEEVSSSLRKHNEKDENMRGNKRKIDCDLPVKVDVITSEIVSEEEKKAEAVERELLQQRISQTLIRKASSNSKLSAIIERKITQKSTLTRLYMQRIHTNIADSKKFSLIPGISQSLRTRCLVQLQCMTSGCVDVKDIHSAFASLIKDLTPSTALPLSTSTPNLPLKELPNVAGSSLISDAQRLETLLDVSRVAHQMGYTKFAQISFDLTLEINCPKSSVMRVKIDLGRALQILASNGSGK